VKAEGSTIWTRIGSGIRPTIIVAGVAALLSYCVVNTNGREDLLVCLEAIERTHPEAIEAEILVLDNASEDGSVEAVREWERSRAGETTAGELRLIARERRAGKAENDSTLLREARGEYCLLLNEDSELRPGAARVLLEALQADPGAATAGAQLLDSSGRPVPCAWRFPGVRTALVGAVFLHRRLTVQSGAGEVRPVDWAQSSALLVRRRAAEEVGYLDPDFFVYYDECDFCKRLADAGWRTFFVPPAEAVHHDQLSTDLGSGLPRIVEFHRNRDLYMRKHHSLAAALAVRALTAWAYALRALVATVLPRRPARIYWAHARQALVPNHGTSIRDRTCRGSGTHSVHDSGHV
jgi:N-acetylglucosaminyl-diphospho-decaprenol L-rhamnosyltransferase